MENLKIPKTNPFPKNTQKRKFILRNIIYEEKSLLYARKVNLKGLYLKKIKENPYRFFWINSNEVNEGRLIKKKLLKYLTYIKIVTCARLHWVETLKHCKALKTFILNSNNECTHAQNIPLYIRKGLKSVSVIDLKIEEVLEADSMKLFLGNLCKAISTIKTLSVYKRNFGFREIEDDIIEEYKEISQYLKRSPKSQTFVYEQVFGGHIPLEGFLQGNQENSCLTGLTMTLFRHQFSSFAGFRNNFVSETNEDEEKLPIEYSNKQELEIFEKEIQLYFRFYLFSNLRKLVLRVSKRGIPPLGSFVTQSFSALNKLESLKINFEIRPIGTAFIFKALLGLPLLKAFSFSVPAIKNEEWDFLDKFVQAQTQLVFLELIVTSKLQRRRTYFEQNQRLTKFIEKMKENCILKYLSIKSKFWSLESISNGIKHLTNCRLKSLVIEGFDDAMTSALTTKERIEGLCQFITNQKDSLCYLTVSIPFVVKVDIVDRIAGAIGNLKELLELNLDVNSDYVFRNNFLKDFEEMTPPIFSYDEVKKELTQTPTRYFKVRNMFDKLEKLDKLQINFGPISGTNVQSVEWFVNIFIEMRKLKSLRTLLFKVPPFHFGKDLITKIEAYMLGLEKVTSVKAFFHHLDLDLVDKEDLSMFIQTAVRVKEKNSLRCDLMF